MVDLKGKTVVIVGASSGIGRAAAQQFAKEGANLVLAARREAMLHTLASECEKLGVQTLVVPLDVTSKGAVENMARQAYERFGTIDVWLNNAGVYMMSLFEDLPYEEFRRIIEVNFMGYVNSTYAVLPFFRRQGYGTLIMTASLDSKVTYPYVTAYAASKHAIYGFATTLRQELKLDPKAKDIHISLVMPASIDTPLFKHSANHTGRAIKAMPPVYPPEQVARTIVNMAKVPRREAFVGNAARLFRLQFLLTPGLADRLFGLMTDKQHLNQKKAAPSTSGNLFEPMLEGGEVSGGWGGQAKSRVRTAITGVVGALSLLLVWQRLHKDESKKALV